MSFTRSRVANIAALGILGLLAAGLVQRHNALETVTTETEKRASYVDEVNPRAQGWRYSVERDEMRGTATKVARLQADDYNPYITPTLVLWKRQDGRVGAQLEGSLVVGSTGVQCDPQTMTVAVKIDGRPIRNLRCEMGMSVGIENTLVSLLRGSEYMMLEVGGATGGRQQYKFSTSGLKL